MTHSWRMRLSLQALLDGEVSEKHRAALEAHLERCAKCGAAMGELAVEDRRLRAAAVQPTPLPPAAARALFQRALSEAELPRRERKGVAPFGWALAAVMVALTLGLVGSSRLRSGAGAGGPQKRVIAARPMAPAGPGEPSHRPLANRSGDSGPQTALPGKRTEVRTPAWAVAPASDPWAGRGRRQIQTARAVGAWRVRPRLALLRDGRRRRGWRLQVGTNRSAGERLAQVTSASSGQELASLSAGTLAGGSTVTRQEPLLSHVDPPPNGGTEQLTVGGASTASDPDLTETAAAINPTALEGGTLQTAAAAPARPAMPLLLVAVSSGPTPSPIVVTQAPESAPGFARVAALRPEAGGGTTWTQATATVGPAGSQIALVMLGSAARQQ
jgi:anti-sigma factor RsiW